MSLTEPERPRQVRRWQVWEGRYHAVLGCHRCAAQAGYGHAHGFSVIHPPCDSCRAKVAALPVPAVNGWRKLRDDSASVCEMTTNAVPVSLDQESLRRSLTGDRGAA